MNSQRSVLPSVLFLTYDGLLDQLGQSQIIPYLLCVQRHPRDVYVISFEKENKLHELSGERLAHVKTLGFVWIYLKFTKKLGAIGKILDLIKFAAVSCFFAIRHKNFHIHARGHVPVTIALLLKRLFSLRLLFDFRGFWADERVDKGGWDFSKKHHYLQFRFYKYIERKALEHSDGIVCLTKSAVKELIRLGTDSKDKITVIPCCADFDFFRCSSDSTRVNARNELGLPLDGLVIGYSGSIGRMYLLESYLDFLELADEKYPNVHGLALTQDIDLLEEEIKARKSRGRRVKLVAFYAQREDMARLLPAIDLMTCFIKTSYARQAASPTKIAEALAVGLPIVYNHGIGDSTEILTELQAGKLIDLSSQDAMKATVTEIPKICSLGGARLRVKARQILGLEIADRGYQNAYRNLDLLTRQFDDSKHT